MGQFFKSVRFKIILCITAFFLGIALFSVTKDGKASSSSQVVNSILNPIRKFSNGISDKVSLVVDLFINAEDYEKKNQETLSRHCIRFVSVRYTGRRPGPGGLKAKDTMQKCK